MFQSEILKVKITAIPHKNPASKDAGNIWVCQYYPTLISISFGLVFSALGKDIVKIPAL